jgi:primase-polymerase (primpol)-like protein
MKSPGTCWRGCGAGTAVRGVYLTTTAKTTEPGFLELRPDGIPEYLKIRPQWVGWEAELKPDGKINKIPQIAGTSRRASSTDLLTWRSFEEAYQAYEAGKHAGIGFVLCSADPFVVVDFDNCRDPGTGEIDPDVLEYAARFENRYLEISPVPDFTCLPERGSGEE